VERDVLDALLQSPHQFSIALNIEERKNGELRRYDLYDELVAINELEIVAELDVDGDLEVGGEEK